MPKKKTETVEVLLKHTYFTNNYTFTFLRHDDSIVVRAISLCTGQWCIKMVSMEDIKTLLDIDPSKSIVIKED